MLLWLLLAALYLAALVFLGLTTLRKGHTLLFWVGIISRSCGSSARSWGQPTPRSHVKPGTPRSRKVVWTRDDDPDPRSTGPELRSERLGFALRALAAELVDERRKVAQLRQEIAELRARLKRSEAEG